ncbi:MAG TPA: dihydrodipicolinate synthase family protein [Candidatus Baltobacteraceae bacterium]|jgi:4-hydroxy-tetrahydrodipicolinate synthase
MAKVLGGVMAAAITPFDRRAQPHHARYIAHCKSLLQNGCDGINVLGTTGEANSIGLADRFDLMDAVASSGLPMDRMMVGTGAPAVEDAIRLTKHAQACGFSAALVLPPFYYKGVTDDGIFAFLARLIERSDPRRIKIYLYNFPAMTGLWYSVTLIERLVAEFPGIVAGIKDSANDRDYQRELLKRLPKFAVFPGTEGYIAEAKRDGCAGCISASVNVTSREAQAAWSASDADFAAKQAHVAELRTTIQSQPLIPAIKAIKSRIEHNDKWERLLPPLVPLTIEQRGQLFSALGDWIAQPATV